MGMFVLFSLTPTKSRKKHFNLKLKNILKNSEMPTVANLNKTLLLFRCITMVKRLVHRLLSSLLGSFSLSPSFFSNSESSNSLS